jgi:hypothetical protein
MIKKAPKRGRRMERETIIKKECGEPSFSVFMFCIDFFRKAFHFSLQSAAEEHAEEFP